MSVSVSLPSLGLSCGDREVYDPKKKAAYQEILNQYQLKNFDLEALKKKALARLKNKEKKENPRPRSTN